VKARTTFELVVTASKVSETIPPIYAGELSFMWEEKDGFDKAHLEAKVERDVCPFG